MSCAGRIASPWKGCQMGMFDRFRSAGRTPAGGSESNADTSGQDALRLIDEGNALEAEDRIEEAMQRYLEAIRLVMPSCAHHRNSCMLHPHRARALRLQRVDIDKGHCPAFIEPA